MCDLYEIQNNILIIIIISLCQILQTHARTNGRTHAHACARTRVRTHPRERLHTPNTHTHTHTHRSRCIAIRCQPTAKARTAGDNSGSLAFEINTGTGDQVSRRFSHIKQMLGRTDTRTRERMYCQTIRTVRYIFRDDRARIATCRLRTPTDRQTDIYYGYTPAAGYM